MPVEDRTIDTPSLRRAVGAGDGWLQLADGLLDRLEPTGVHVVVPAGRVAHDGDDIVLVELVLRTTGCADPKRLRVPMPLERFTELPTAFETISRFEQVIGSGGDIIEVWLANEVAREAGTEDCD